MISIQRFLLIRMPVPAAMTSSRQGRPEYLTDVACSLWFPAGVGNIVGRSQSPLTVFAEETEVFGMVVFVDADDVEDHPSEHLLHLYRILSQVTGQCK